MRFTFFFMQEERETHLARDHHLSSFGNNTFFPKQKMPSHPIHCVGFSTLSLLGAVTKNVILKDNDEKVVILFATVVG